MIRGQYQRAWEIYEELQKEFERNPERVKDSQPIVYFALAEEAPRINKVKAQLKREQERRAEVESEWSDELTKVCHELASARAEANEQERRADEQERRANELEVQQQPATLTFEPGEREALMERGWRKAV